VNRGRSQVIELRLNRAEDMFVLARQPAGLSAAQAGLAEQMIEYSDNDAATALWDAVGNAAGIRAFGELVGLTRHRDHR